MVKGFLTSADINNGSDKILVFITFLFETHAASPI